MLQAIRSRLPYFRKASTITSSKQTSSQVRELYSLYRQLSELPLKNFIDCCVDSNLSSLVKEGSVPDYVLQEAWADIQQQYADAMGGAEKDHLLQLVKQIHILQCDYNIILLLVEQLRECYVKKFADELNTLLNTSFKFDITKIESYDKDLERCTKRANAIKMQLALKKAQYDGIEKKFDGKTVKPTREYFISLLKGIKDFAGYNLTDEITTYEFCLRVKDISNHQKKR